MIAEAGYLIAGKLGAAAEARFFRSIAEGEIIVEMLTVADHGRVVDLVETYQELPLGGIDASVIAIAERLGGTRIATLNRRHFAAVRPAHIAAFELVS